MDVGQGSSIEEIKDLQTNTSWIPATPGKPGFAALPPISKYRQENQPAQVDWLELQMKKAEAAAAHAAGATAEAQNAAAYNGSTSSVTVDRCFTTWEAAVGTKSEMSGGGIKMSNNFSSDNVDMWTNVSFGDLLAMAHAAGTTPAAGNAKDDTAYSARSYFKPLVSSQSADGSSTFPSSPFNSNSPLRMTDAILSNVPFQLEPVTPDLIKSKGQASNASNLDINVTTLPRGVQSNEDTIQRAEANELQQSREQSELVLNQSELQENHKFDMEGKQDSELNNTTPEKKPRRRKHRPKVVVEGKPKRSPKPRTEKQAGSLETKTEKRKYVRRNKVGSPAPTSAEEVNNTIDEGKTPSSKETPQAKRKYVRRNQVKKSTEKPSEEGSSGTTDPKKVSPPRKSCKRTLNFEFERQASDEHSSYRPSTLDLHANQTESTAQCVQSAQLGQGMEGPNEKTVVGTTYNINCSLNQELRNYLSQHEVQYLSSPSLDKVGWNHDEVMVGNQNESTRGNYRINFSDLTRDKQASILQMTPQSPNCSNCSSSTCLPHGKGLKRQRSYRTDEAQFYSLNARGVYFNSMQAYQAILPANKPEVYSSLGMHCPAIYKKKRTEEGHSSPASYIKHFTSEINHVLSSQCNISGSPSNNSSTNIAYNRLQNSDFVPAVVEAEKLRKRRSKGATQVHELASVREIYKQFQTSTSKYATKCRLGERYKTSHLSNACMEAPIADTRAPMKTKKQSKKSTFVSSTASNMYIHQQFTTNARGPPPALTWRGMSPIDEIAEHLQRLDLNRESSQIQGQQGSVTYHTKFQGESALVLYQRDGSIVPFGSSLVRKRKPRPKVDVDDETDRVWKLLLQNINSEGVDGTDEDKAKWWEEERRVFNSRADSFIARMRLVQGDRRFSPWKGSVLDSVVGVFLTQNVSDHLSSSAFMSLAAHFPLKTKSSTQKHERRTAIIIEEPEVCATDPIVSIRWHEDQANQSTRCQDSWRVYNTDSNEEKTAVNSSESSENSTHCIQSAEHSVILQSDSSREGSDLYHESTLMGFKDKKELNDLPSSPSSVVSSENSVVIQTSERTDTSSFCSSTSFLKLLQMAGTSGARGTTCTEYLQEGGNFPVLSKERSALEQSGSLVECAYPELSTTLRSETYISCNDPQNKLDIETVNNAEVNAKLQFQTEHRNCNVPQVPEAPTSSETNIEVTERASIVVDSCKSEQRAVESNLKNVSDHACSKVDSVNDNPSKAKKGQLGKEKENIDWDSLRLEAQANGKKRERTANTMDSLDWEAVRCANVNEIAHTIKERGMNNKLAERIKNFLNRIVSEHGSIDLEWLRDVPPDKAKEYLLSIRGLGLKSVECVRLLTLHHLAFPVDTNVGRIAVRLGWVPLQPLPESLQLHLLELYPVLESIQKYLWPRLCKLDQRTLYELHYHMITFGKVFCTKSKPNCNACPLRGECRHFASAFASARLALPVSEEKSIASATENKASNNNPRENFTHLPLPLPPGNQQPVEHQKLINSAPIIEVPATPEPIVELPATPEQEQIQAPEIDIEDNYFEDPCEIPTIELNMAEFTQNLKKYVENNMELHQVEMSNALVALTSEAASIPMPKLKNVSRLRTEHQVYELPDSHPLLEGLDKREPDDPCFYLLAIWTPGETANSFQPPETQCNSQESGKLCENETCSSCNSIREAHSQTVRGTLLIPCRTAMRGSFPLNGTYFQVNEVFADHDSSLNPINVPRDWLWNLPRRTVYFGTSIPTIFKGLTTESIQHCFWRGFVCVRGFDQKTRAPRPLMARLHFPASKLNKTKGKTDEDHGAAH
ncbi:PREDICTED: protein ROS1-like [Nicotiana attenuata]|uniref:Protein ros1 n=1 Tax=Nicotiana attenuata TaxID=49451 RepID=A0A1J6JUC6_NICAT|nr:PREDICTED: protein ROS1-like [Nicotiana attenuata]OIT21314.1 protein ros1 [Nicotiana attenuata]